MWPFDRKRKKEEAARKAEAERREQQERLLQAARERRPIINTDGRTSIGPAAPPMRPRATGMSRNFEAPYGTSRSTPAEDWPAFYAAPVHSMPNSHDSSPSHCSPSGSSYSSSDSSSSSDSGSCGGSD